MALCRVKNYLVIKADIMKAEPERSSSQRLSSDSDCPARGEEAPQDTTKAKCLIGVYKAYHHALHGECARMCCVGVKAQATSLLVLQGPACTLLACARARCAQQPKILHWQRLQGRALMQRHIRVPYGLHDIKLHGVHNIKNKDDSWCNKHHNKSLW